MEMEKQTPQSIAVKTHHFHKSFEHSQKNTLKQCRCLSARFSVLQTVIRSSQKNRSHIYAKACTWVSDSSQIKLLLLFASNLPKQNIKKKIKILLKISCHPHTLYVTTKVIFNTNISAVKGYLHSDTKKTCRSLLFLC